MAAQRSFLVVCQVLLLYNTIVRCHSSHVEINQPSCPLTHYVTFHGQARSTQAHSKYIASFRMITRFHLPGRQAFFFLNQITVYRPVQPSHPALSRSVKHKYRQLLSHNKKQKSVPSLMHEFDVIIRIKFI